MFWLQSDTFSEGKATVFTLKQPTEAEIVAYLIAQQQQPFSYGEVGCTSGKTPKGYNADSHQVLLGQGEKIEFRFRCMRPAMCQRRSKRL